MQGANPPQNSTPVNFIFENKFMKPFTQINFLMQEPYKALLTSHEKVATKLQSNCDLSTCATNFQSFFCIFTFFDQPFYSYFRVTLALKKQYEWKRCQISRK